MYVLNAESGIGGREVAKWKVRKTEGTATDNQVGTVVKNLPANAGDRREVGLIPGRGRSPGGGNHNPLQYSCLENLMDTEAWWAAVQRVTKSQTQLSD